MGETQAEIADFVRVKDGGFVVGKDDLPFRFVGANSFLLLVSSCDCNFARHWICAVLGKVPSMRRCWKY